jgi:hypothetical protein
MLQENKHEWRYTNDLIPRYDHLIRMVCPLLMAHQLLW